MLGLQHSIFSTCYNNLKGKPTSYKKYWYLKRNNMICKCWSHMLWFLDHKRKSLAFIASCALFFTRASTNQMSSTYGSNQAYIFVATIFTFEFFNFNILLFDQEIRLCKPFQFLWSFRSACFKAHLQNLKTNTFIKSLYPKTTKNSLEMLKRS